MRNNPVYISVIIFFLCIAFPNYSKAEAMKRLISLVITLTLVVTSALPLISINVTAIELKAGEFNPVTGEVELDFKIQFTQEVSIEVLVEGEHFGWLMKNEELTDYNGELVSHDPVISALTEMGVDNVIIEIDSKEVPILNEGKRAVYNSYLWIFLNGIVVVVAVMERSIAMHRLRGWRKLQKISCQFRRHCT